MRYGKRILMATVAACLFTAGLLANTSVFPTGVTVNKPELAYRTYVLFDGRDGKSHLIDMNGKEVRSWNYSGFPSMMIDPELIGGKRGHIFVQKDYARRPGAGAESQHDGGRTGLGRQRGVGMGRARSRRRGQPEP